jgi:hypothetical protein
MVLYILDNGKMDNDTEEEIRFGKMDHIMKDIGKIIRLMEKAV